MLTGPSSIADGAAEGVANQSDDHRIAALLDDGVWARSRRLDLEIVSAQHVQ